MCRKCLRLLTGECVCFRSRLTSVIAGLWAQETCDDVRRRSRGAALEFKSMSSQSNLLCVQSASFRRSLLNYGLIGHATKAADEKDNFLLLIGHFTCASRTPVCS